MHHANRPPADATLFTALRFVIPLLAVWMPTMPGCATNRPERSTVALVDALPRQTGRFDQRGLRLLATHYDGEQGPLFASGSGQVQSVGMTPIDVYGLQFNLDGEVLSLSVRRELGGTSRFAGPRGELSFDETFEWHALAEEAMRIAEGEGVTVRAIGTRDTTPWFPLSDEASAAMREWLGLPERPSPGVPAQLGARRVTPSGASDRYSHSDDPMYPFKLVTILAEPAEFGGARCGLAVAGEGWHKSRVDGVWNAVLRRAFGVNEVSCLLESDNASTVQRVELEAEFYQPGLHESAMLLQFAQSAQVLMHPARPPNEFAEAVTSMGEWSDDQWELRRQPYTNGGFGLMLRRNSP